MVEKPLKTEILLAFGGNLVSHAGTPFQTINAAIDILAGAGIEFVRFSSAYQSPAVTLGPSDVAPEYTNAAALARTVLTPKQLLDLGQKTERQLGRTAAARWSARTLDIDLLSYGTAILPDRATWQGLVASDDPAAILPEPVLPHPRLHCRGFVLAPLFEIAPDWRHPVLKASVRDLHLKAEADGFLEGVVKGGMLGKNLAP